MYRRENKNLITYTYKADGCTVIISAPKSLEDFDIKIRSNTANLRFSANYNNFFDDYHFFGHCGKKILPSFFLHEHHTINVVSAYKKVQAEMEYAINCFKNYITREMGV